ncbi:hypothetical protein YpUG050454_1722 [Yersinia pestis biovar Antiqua str. UG05-0454]|nr:hypothetical protein YpUG050454_1722 [Yersinia pestis biovar Antiqua str. UG05-0454]
MLYPFNYGDPIIGALDADGGGPVHYTHFDPNNKQLAICLVILSPNGSE